MSHLREVDIKTPEVRVSEQAVKLLRDTLAMAERGDLSEVMVVAIEQDGATYTAYTDSLDARMRVGMLEIAKAHFLDDVLATEEVE